MRVVNKRILASIEDLAGAQLAEREFAMKRTQLMTNCLDQMQRRDPDLGIE